MTKFRWGGVVAVLLWGGKTHSSVSLGGSSGDVLIFPRLMPATSSELQFQLHCVANLCRLCCANNASCKWAARGRSAGWSERWL